MANALYSTYQSGLMYSIFNNVSFPAPSALFVGLASIPPTNTSVSEVANVGGYARQPISSTQANWSYPYSNSGVMFNNPQINFGVASAYIGWVSGIFLADNVGYGAGITGVGNIGFYGTASTAKEYTQGDQIIFPPSSIMVRMY